MTNGQIAQFRELRKCSFALWTRRGKRVRSTYSFVFHWAAMADIVPEFPMSWWDKKQLRRLWHAYRGQIAAMRKNRARL
jgi:hypothetical protein